MSFIATLPPSRLDLVSVAIHVDTTSDKPLDWSAFRPSDLLLGAGDVVDDTDTVAEIARAAVVYERIIFFTGDHDPHPVIHRTPADADVGTIQRGGKQIKLLACYINWARGTTRRWRIPEYRPRVIPFGPATAAGAAS